MNLSPYSPPVLEGSPPRSDSRHRLEEATHLEDAHAESVAQDLVGLIVVAVPNVCGRHEQFKGVILLYVQCPILYFFLELSHSFLPVTAITPNTHTPGEPVNQRG